MLRVEACLVATGDQRCPAHLSSTSLASGRALPGDCALALALTPPLGTLIPSPAPQEPCPTAPPWDLSLLSVPFGVLSPSHAPQGLAAWCPSSVAPPLTHLWVPSHLPLAALASLAERFWGQPRPHEAGAVSCSAVTLAGKTPGSLLLAWEVLIFGTLQDQLIITGEKKKKIIAKIL